MEAPNSETENDRENDNSNCRRRKAPLPKRLVGQRCGRGEKSDDDGRQSMQPHDRRGLPERCELAEGHSKLVPRKTSEQIGAGQLGEAESKGQRQNSRRARTPNHQSDCKAQSGE